MPKRGFTWRFPNAYGLLLPLKMSDFCMIKVMKLRTRVGYFSNEQRKNSIPLLINKNYEKANSISDHGLTRAHVLYP